MKPTTGNWARGIGTNRPYRFAVQPPEHISVNCHTRTQLSSTFPTQHWHCDYCGEHWLGCCPTEYVPECTDPGRCAFEKEMEL